MMPAYLCRFWGSHASAIGNHLWQSTIFAALAGLITLALRNNKAQYRYWLWMAASVKFLLPFSLLVTLGSYAPSRRVLPERNSIAFSAISEMGQPFAAPAIASGEFSEQPEHESLTKGLVVIAISVWATGFLTIMWVWYVRWKRISVLLREAQVLGEGREVEALRRLRQMGATHTAIPLSLSRSTLEPGIVGLVRPVLIWPAGLSDRLTDPQLEAILAHEICHVRRRDNANAFIQMIAEATFWFHPLVWWIGARLLEEREFACDEEVVRLYNQPKTYAESLLTVCKFYLESSLPCVSGVTGSTLNKRIVQIMQHNVGATLTYSKRALLLAAGVLAILLPIGIGAIAESTDTLQLQTSPIDWAAGRKLDFEVASVRQNISSEKPSVNVDITSSGSFVSTNGSYVARNISLIEYVAFAYKLTNKQLQSVVSQVPWTATDHFDIVARAEGNPSKDEYRLMMQSLLEDRFGMIAHYETRQAAVFVLVMDRPGKLGPQLRVHVISDPICSASPLDSEHALPVKASDGYPDECGGIMRMAPSAAGRLKEGGRAVDMTLVASVLTGVGVIDRPLIDQTGLGPVDFNLEWKLAPENVMPGRPYNPDESAPSFQEALEDQLGIKMVSRKGPIQFFVVDHLAHPSPN